MSEQLQEVFGREINVAQDLAEEAAADVLARMLTIRPRPRAIARP